jgi:hypothetical protein
MRAGAYEAIVRENTARSLDAGEAGGRLELRGSDGQRVHVLQEQALRRGDVIELLLADGYWLRGRYDWSGIEARWPGLRIDLGGVTAPPIDGGIAPAAVMALHPEAIVRWPRVKR